MLMYRIKQFYFNITANMDYKDKQFVKLHLNKVELNLFNKLSVGEQKHSVKVAYDILKYCDNMECNKERLVKLGLLHDIGKIYCKINVIEKSMLVILDKVISRKMKKINKSKKIYTFYNHGIIGYKILKNMNYDDKFLYAIKNHHTKDNYENEELKLLIFCDNKN